MCPMKRLKRTSLLMANMQYRFAKHSLAGKSFAAESRELTYRGATYMTRVFQSCADDPQVLRLNFQALQQPVAA